MFDFSFILLVFLLITGLNYLGLIIYLTIGWFKVNEFHCSETNFITKVSILVPFRNEENNIITCLECIIKQDFPAHLIEIILIDDHSTDLSLEKAIKFKQSNPDFNINIIELKKLNHKIGSKKLALKEGMAHSSGELIITTDADCKMNKNWIKNIVSYYEKDNPSMIVGPVCFFNVHSIFGSLQQLEFLSLQSVGLAAVGIKHPILSNGANLAFKKELFYAANGFKGNEDIASGDDVFLLHQFHRMFPQTIHFIKSYEAIVFTEHQKNISGFISQRKRWASKSKSYQDVFAKYVAISVFLFSLSLLCAMIFSVFHVFVFLYTGIFIAVKLVIDFPLLFQITKFVKKKELLLLVPILALIYPFYIVFIGVYGSFGTYKWKERKLKQ